MSSLMEKPAALPFILLIFQFYRVKEAEIAVIHAHNKR